MQAITGSGTPFPMTALERIDALERRMQELDARSAGSYQFAERAIQNSVGLSQSLAAVTKTLAALISTLTDQKIVTNESILDGIRKLDEQNSREEIQDGIKQGVLKAIDTVTEGSVVVIKQVVVSKEDPLPILMAEYRIIELMSQYTSAELRQRFAGMKVGESFTMSSDQQDNVTTVVEAYEVLEKRVTGEEPNAQTSNQPESLPKAGQPQATVDPGLPDGAQGSDSVQ